MTAGKILERFRDSTADLVVWSVWWEVPES